MKKTCGIYLINKHNNLLIVHPTNHPNKFHWSIPKGEPDENDGSLLETAIREMFEETGIQLNIDNIIPYYLGSTVYRNKNKTLYSFLIVDKDLDDVDVVCNSFVNLETHSFPENDMHIWINLSKVTLIKTYLHESQISNIDKIKKIIKNA